MQSPDEVLKIDQKRAAASIEGYINKLKAKHSAQGILMGLSGGVDSALLAALTVRAVGKECCHVYYLPDRDSDASGARMAHLVADWLGLDLKVRNFESIMRKRKVYSPLIMKASVFSRSINRRFLNGINRNLFGESAFLSTLKDGAGEFTGNFIKRLFFKATVMHVENGFNARHRYRREFLEKVANEEGLLLLGAANRSEGAVGWFVKDGVDDLPVMPLLGLYKTQIWQLAGYVGIPEQVVEQIPSPDMAKGITDEFAMGISYRKVDLVMDGTDRGLTDQEIMDLGITQKELKLVRDLHKYSAWKRETEHEIPPVDGGVKGGYRVASTS